MHCSNLPRLVNTDGGSLGRTSATYIRALRLSPSVLRCLCLNLTCCFPSWSVTCLGCLRASATRLPLRNLPVSVNCFFSQGPALFFKIQESLDRFKYKSAGMQRNLSRGRLHNRLIENIQFSFFHLLPQIVLVQRRKQREQQKNHYRRGSSNNCVG